MLASTPTIAAVVTIIFGMVDGNVLEKVNHRAHEQALTNANRKRIRAQSYAEMKVKLATAIAMSVAADRLIAKVRRVARQADFTPQAQYILSEAVQEIDDGLPLLEMGKQKQLEATVPTPTADDPNA